MAHPCTLLHIDDDLLTVSREVLEKLELINVVEMGGKLNQYYQVFLYYMIVQQTLAEHFPSLLS